MALCTTVRALHRLHSVGGHCVHSLDFEIAKQLLLVDDVADVCLWLFEQGNCSSISSNDSCNWPACAGLVPPEPTKDPPSLGRFASHSRNDVHFNGSPHGRRKQTREYRPDGCGAPGDLPRTRE